MSEEDSGKKESNIEGTIKAVTGLAKAVPVYDDVAQPAAKEIGKALETVAKTVNVALAPVKGLVWGYDQIESFVTSKVSEKLQKTPEEEIITPKPNVAGPALEALRYAGHEESLRELYANLIASSMDSKTAQTAHPGFVEILKQITPDEAKLLKVFAQIRAFPILDLRSEDKENGKGGVDILSNFSLFGEEAGCEHINLTPNYLDNLCRLGLISIPTFYTFTAPNIYDPLENHPTILSLKKQIEANSKRKPQLDRKGVKVTILGKQL